MRDLPDAVRANASPAWINGLPELIDTLAGRWGLRLGAAFPDSTEGYVVGATRTDGTPAVLKLHTRAHLAAAEIAFLRLAGDETGGGNGAGCVRLLEADGPAGALLLEHLGPALSDMDVAQPRRLEILTGLAVAVWRRSDGGLATGARRAAELDAEISQRWRPELCSERSMRQAREAAGSRRAAYRPERAVLIHGDVHQWNALSVPGGGFRLVDPDGLLAEPECDLGVLMREDPSELMTGDPYDRARLLAARTGTDAAAIWEWGLADRVACGLRLVALGVDEGRRMLAAADRISASG